VGSEKVLAKVAINKQKAILSFKIIFHFQGKNLDFLPHHGRTN